MPIYHDGKKMKPYRGYRKPVNVYYGDKKVAGWHSDRVDPRIEFAHTTYNDAADLIVFGNTKRVSDTLASASGQITLSDEDATQHTTINIPTLRSVGETKDEFHPTTGKITRKCAEIASYDGEYVSDWWISSTGKLENGATIVYILDEPAEEWYVTAGQTIEQETTTYFPKTFINIDDESETHMEIIMLVKRQDEIYGTYLLKTTNDKKITDTNGNEILIGG